MSVVHSWAVVTEVAEVDIALAAAQLTTVNGMPIAPAVMGDNDGRPELSYIPGPRLDVLVQKDSEPGGCLGTVGRVLAALHGARPPSSLGPARIEAPPWEPLTPSTWLGLSTVQRRLVGVLHTDDPVREQGRRTRDQLLDGITWIHGDARTNNVCVTPAGQPRLIDWEVAGIGRAEADLGAMSASLMADGLLAVTAPAGPAAKAALTRAVTVATGRIRAVLRGYRAGTAQRLDPELLAAAVGCALLTRAFMRTSVTSWDRLAKAQYEIGRGLLLDPRRWRAIDHDA
ncbi:phosphotransferase [Phytoactinopolyspora limicola]|uniref:phosphotransferase n=1 Tax=Phytoactinopolyspora limicola TaxID=2715536 RepID=UPI001A9C67B0|nr:phosphotransferase [Phytoactinopolyspora limicola]